MPSPDIERELLVFSINLNAKWPASRYKRKARQSVESHLRAIVKRSQRVSCSTTERTPRLEHGEQARLTPCSTQWPQHPSTNSHVSPP